jgi:hypothetical protein
MKKAVITFIILVATVTAGNAQFFVEGGLGVSFSEGEYTQEGSMTNRTSGSTFNISPKVGYWVNDRMAVGASVFYYGSTQKTAISGPDNPDPERKTELRQPRLGFSVFGRYQLLQISKFSVLAECSMGMHGNKTKQKSESITKETSSDTYLNMNMFPLISYDLTDRISLITTCDFMSLRFTSYTFKNKEIDRKTTSHGFSFGTNSSIFNSLSDIRIGFMYKF